MTMDYSDHSDEKRPLLTHPVQGSADDSASRKHCCSTMSTKRKVCYTVLLLLAPALVLTAILGVPYTMAAIYTWVIDSMMVLDPSSPLFKEWVTPNIPMFQSYYFFDIQNPEEFKMGAKPVVIERGPYVYRLTYDRLNLTFNDNGTLSHYPQYFYYFDEEKSVGPESDRIITLNMPLVTVAHFVKDSGPVIQLAVNTLMEYLGEELTLNLTVKELLWGYKEPLFELIQPIISIPGFDQGVFGFLIGFNGTTNDWYNVYDGKANQTMLNVVDNYQGVSHLSWWATVETNTIRGTDGTMYHPYLSSSEDLFLFHPDLCRSVQYLYHNDTTYKGVPLMRYNLAPFTYDNGTDYPPNEGFCHGKPDLCGPSGVMRQDPCRYGSPSAISNPHFFQGDPSLYEAVPGLDPKAEYHQHYIMVEPMMGMPYVLKMRLQINMKIDPVKRIKEVSRVRDMIMPVLWFEQSVEADDRIVNYYEKGFVLSAYIANIVKWVLFAFAIVMFLMTLVSYFRWTAYSPESSDEEKDEKIINESPSDVKVVSSGNINGDVDKGAINGSFVPEA